MTLRSRWNAVRARRWLRECAEIGDDPYLAGKPTINAAEGRLVIGDRVRLASRPVPSHFVSGPGALLHIGSDVRIGCGAAIAAFQHIHIGSGTHIGPFAIIMDTNFHGSAGDQSIHHDCRPVIIGNDCRIGSRVTISRGATIGDGAEILAGSVVSSVIPAAVCAAGSRARIIGRSGDAATRWDSAAAVLPEILCESLGLPFPPDIDASTISRRLWTDSGIEKIREQIAKRLGVELDPVAARQIETFAGLAAVVQASRKQARPSPRIGC